MAVVSLILSKFQNIFAIFVGSDISILHKKGGQSCRSELETLTPGITPRVGVSYSGFNSHERKRVHRMAIILAIIKPQLALTSGPPCPQQERPFFW